VDEKTASVTKPASHSNSAARMTVMTAVGMALSGKDTGGSQWFVTHGPQPHLDGRYTIFAHVVRGQDVVDRLRRGDRITKVTIHRR
jgi:cyclophilin family peptidyl-prolyl cis-trans isomerase